jgi:hypothetical protein
MGGTGVIDRFLGVFTQYIDSGFGLLQPEVAFVATTLIAIDITLAALFWSWGGDDDIIARLVKKTLFVGVFADFKALDTRLAPVPGEAQHDMVVRLWPGAAGASKEVFTGKLRPHHAFCSGQRMALRECDEENLRPQRFRMAIASRRHTDNKGYVKPCLPNLSNGVSRSPLRNLQIDCRMQFTKLTQ